MQQVSHTKEKLQTKATRFSRVAFVCGKY